MNSSFQGNAPKEYGAFGGGQQGAYVNNDMPDLKPDDPNRVIEYKPQRLFQNPSDNYSLTEANSVANYMSSRYGNDKGILNLCFDIGGSTTDISALFKLRTGLTMIKQNSIRFAAQRVSGASRQVKGFEKVLNQICDQFGIKVLGLNKGDNRFTPDTAPYYFDQIVDLLTDEQLPSFYRLIQAECPQLMWVNLYVTGLLLYYAGQISHKLIDDIFHTSPEELLPGSANRPYIRVTFAGKGSRLLQWLATIHPEVAQQYYFQLFVQGYGGQQAITGTLGDWPRIELPTLENSKDIKYEVSKGLAKNNTELCNPKDDTPSEIIGEAGFTLTTRNNESVAVDYVNSITPEMIEHIGEYFDPDRSNPCQKFYEFCDIFYSAAKQLFDLDISQDVFMEGFKNMNIVQYVQSLPEFHRAQSEKATNKGEFDFVAPIIILEGMKFYDDYLLKALK